MLKFLRIGKSIREQLDIVVGGPTGLDRPV
jgi:hypothetical protein